MMRADLKKTIFILGLCAALGVPSASASTVELHLDSDSKKAGALKTILFYDDSYKLTAVARAGLRYNADFLNLNPEIGDAEMGPLAAGYRDALEGAPDRRSHPSGVRPEKGIDHIFVSPTIRVRRAAVIMDAGKASDHNPVVVEVERS